MLLPITIHHRLKKKRQDGHVQATCAGVAGGAAALGATGGATGLAAGSAVGAALGLVPAIFTFGLSIPVGAAIGGDHFFFGKMMDDKKGDFFVEG